MEFLFWNQVASYEALIVLFCVILIASIFLYDLYLYIARLIGVLTPRKEYIKEKMAEESTQGEVTPEPIEPILSVETDTAKVDEVSTYLTSSDDREKSTKDSLHEAWNPEEVEVKSPFLDPDPAESSDIPEEKLEEKKEDSGVIEKIEEEKESVEIPQVETSEEESIQEQTVVSDEPEVMEIPENTEWKVEEVPEMSEGEQTKNDETESLVENTIEETENIPEAIDIPKEENSITETPPEELWREEISEVSEESSDTSSERNETREWKYPKEIITPTQSSTRKSSTLSPEKRDKIVEITQNVKTLLARGHVPEARGLIIEGLSLSKDHRELNIFLAELYERDHAYEKAEYIYKDLAHIYTDDPEILMRLANTLAMQHKYRVSYELYRKVLEIQWETEEILYTLCHLASELGETDDTYDYSKKYTKQFPKNPEILWLLSQSQIATGRRKDAIETLIKLKNLTPYSQEIVDLIGKLVTEEEMAGNFGGEK